MKTATQQDEFRSLLHPVNALDVPVPGFTSHDALIAWARTKDRSAIQEAALDVLREDEWPQQYAALGVLRALGISVDGEGHGESFRWIVDGDDGRVVIEPRHKPVDPSTTRGVGPSQLDADWIEQLKKLLAEAINALDDRPKVAVTLHYWEGLTYAELGEVLGIDAGAAEEEVRNALRLLRQALAPHDHGELRRYVTRTLEVAPLNSPALVLAAVLAA